jgi:hypothetical protein
MSTSRRKPTGKAAAIQETQEEGESSTFQATPPAQRQDPILESQPIDSILTQTLEPRAQLNQEVFNVLGVPVQLTDDQFQSLLARLSAKDLRPSGPDTQEPLNSQPIDPEDSPSDGSDHGSHRDRWSRPHRRYQRSRSRPRSVKRSPKHADPDKLNDGTSPTYIAWRSLLRGKLRANADWWPTEQDRINYVFGCTEGKAQSFLEPRIDEDSLDPWLTVDEMLEYLNTVFRNHFETEQSENSFYALKHSAGQDFNEFHTEFARLASVGRVPSITWRSHLWRKLNREFRNRLLATHHQYPTYQELVRECQRLSVDLEELYRQFPPVAQTQRRRPETTVARPIRSRGSSQQLAPGLLPAPRHSSRPLLLDTDRKRDSATPGPRASTVPATDPAKATCFNCGEVGHYSNSCPNPRTTPRINEIEEDIEASDDEGSGEDDTDESEN